MLPTSQPLPRAWIPSATPKGPVTDEPVDTDTDPHATTHLHSSAHVRVELPARGRDGVALVAIARPEVLNALSFEVVGEIADAFEAFDGDLIAGSSC